MGGRELLLELLPLGPLALPEGEELEGGHVRGLAGQDAPRPLLLDARLPAEIALVADQAAVPAIHVAGPAVRDDAPGPRVLGGCVEHVGPAHAVSQQADLVGIDGWNRLQERYRGPNVLHVLHGNQPSRYPFALTKASIIEAEHDVPSGVQARREARIDELLDRAEPTRRDDGRTSLARPEPRRDPEEAGQPGATGVEPHLLAGVGGCHGPSLLRSSRCPAGTTPHAGAGRRVVRPLSIQRHPE